MYIQIYNISTNKSQFNVGVQYYSQSGLKSRKQKVLYYSVFVLYS